MGIVSSFVAGYLRQKICVFSKVSRAVLWTTRLPVQWVQRAPCPEVKATVAQTCTFTLRVVPRVRTSGSVPPFTHVHSLVACTGTPLPFILHLFAIRQEISDFQIMQICLCRQVVSRKNKIVCHSQITGRKVCNARMFCE